MPALREAVIRNSVDFLEPLKLLATPKSGVQLDLSSEEKSLFATAEDS